VDGTGSGSCPIAGFGISGVEPSCSATIFSNYLYYWFNIKQSDILRS
jgi:hypothetical protein